MSSIHTSIDVVKTGERIKMLIKKNGYKVKEIQNILGLECIQPIYRWMNGKALPTVDNLYILSVLFNVHMEEMLVPCIKIKNNKDN